MLPSKKYDLIIVGAGAAGMAAAQMASQLKLKVAVLDQGRRPGGLIYHNLEQSPFQNHQHLLGPDYFKGKKLVETFNGLDIDYLPHANVWQLSPNEKEVAYGYQGKSYLVEGDKILLAQGGYERPYPINGGTLPRVMTVGAAQLLMKSSKMVAPNAVIAGNGPLILLLAWQYTQAGIPIKGILSTNNLLNYIKAFPHLPKALKASHYLFKGIKLLATLWAKKVPFYTQVKNIEAHGGPSLQEVSFTHLGKRKVLKTQNLFLHQGVIPDIHLSSAARLKHVYHTYQRCWQPQVNVWGESSHQDIYLAGDATHVSGAGSAEQKGFLAALKIAESLGKISSKERETLARPYLKQLKVELSVRPFLDILYGVTSKECLPASKETLVCRCEEIRAREIEDAILEFKAQGHNEIKDFTRAQMGHCQGRQCGPVINEMLRAIRQKTPEEIGYLKGRFPTIPVSIGEFSSLEIPAEKVKASGVLLK